MHPRKEWLAAFEKMGVRLSPESALVQMLSGEPPLASIATRSALRSRRSFRNEGPVVWRLEKRVCGGRASVSAA